MKKLISFAVVSLLASRQIGYCTANAKSAVDTAEDAALGKPPEGETNEQRIERLEATVLALREAASVPVQTLATDSTLDLLIKGAGVEAKDVHWRIRSGLTAAQAVEVALLEKSEAAAAASTKKGAK